MPVIDIFLAALIVYGIIRGLFRGLFVEVAGLLALVLGVWGATHFSHYASSFLTEQFDWQENTIKISAFVITFIAIVVAISLAGKALTKLASFMFLGILNKILGGLFGGVKIALIISVVLMLISEIHLTKTLISEEDQNKSILYEPVCRLATLIVPNLLAASQKLEQSKVE